MSERDHADECTDRDVIYGFEPGCSGASLLKVGSAVERSRNPDTNGSGKNTAVLNATLDSDTPVPMSSDNPLVAVQFHGEAALSVEVLHDASCAA